MFRSTPDASATLGSRPNIGDGGSAYSQPQSPGLAHEFSQLMEGLAPYSAGHAGPSMAGQLIRVPAAVCDQVMAAVQQPTPEGMSLEDSMKLVVQKQNDVNQMKILTNVAGVVAKTVKKDVEALLNSK